MKIVIFANGEIQNYDFIKQYILGANMVICSDGGLRHAHNLGLFPNYIIGDFDSVDSELLNSYREKGCLIEKFPPNKDFTDTEASIERALEHNPTEIIILGGMGSRFDHTLANVHLLLGPLSNGIKATIANENNAIILVDKEVEISGKKGDIVSIIPLTTNVDGVFTKGLLYPLVNAALKIGQSIGVSNIMTENICEISVREGTLIVVRGND